MIRFLLYLIVLCVGLLGAVIWTGEARHLRQALPQSLPGWTTGFDQTAGLRRGRFVQAATGQFPDLTVEWFARKPGNEGWIWDVTLTGEGVAVKSELVLQFWPNRAILRDSAGTVDLAKLSQGAVAGLLRLGDLDATVEVVGLLQSPDTVLRAIIADPAKLPADVRKALQVLGRETVDGITIDLPLRLINW